MVLCFVLLLSSAVLTYFNSFALSLLPFLCLIFYAVIFLPLFMFRYILSNFSEVKLTYNELLMFKVLLLDTFQAVAQGHHGAQPSPVVPTSLLVPPPPRFLPPPCHSAQPHKTTGIITANMFSFI